MKTFAILLPLIFVARSLFAGPTLELYEAILDLVAAGQIETAKTKIETYLEVYPADAQLQEMAKALRSKELVPVPIEPKPQVQKSASLSPDDRLEIDTVVMAAQQVVVMETTLERRDAARQMLARPVRPAARAGNKEWLPYWLARAAIALEADDLQAGWEAGQNLKLSGSMESDDQLTRKVLSQLNLNGWLNLDQEQMTQLKESQEMRLKRLNAWVGVFGCAKANSKGRAPNEETEATFRRIQILETGNRNPEFESYSFSYESSGGHNHQVTHHEHLSIPGNSYYKTHSPETGPRLHYHSTVRLIQADFSDDAEKLSVLYRVGSFAPVKMEFSIKFESNGSVYIIDTKGNKHTKKP